MVGHDRTRDSGVGLTDSTFQFLSVYSRRVRVSCRGVENIMKALIVCFVLLSSTCIAEVASVGDISTAGGFVDVCGLDGRLSKERMEELKKVPPSEFIDCRLDWGTDSSASRSEKFLICCAAAVLTVFHCRSSCASSTWITWERIASRRGPAFSLIPSDCDNSVFIRKLLW